MEDEEFTNLQNELNEFMRGFLKRLPSEDCHYIIYLLFSQIFYWLTRFGQAKGLEREEFIIRLDKTISTFKQLAIQHFEESYDNK